MFVPGLTVMWRVSPPYLCLSVFICGLLGCAAQPADRMEPLAAPGDATRGREVFVSREGGHCVLCHAVPGVDVAGDVGPALAGVGARLDAGQLRLRVADITRVKNGGASKDPQKVIGGAIAGAILGRIIGGNAKGTIIGAAGGAAAGAGVASATARWCWNAPRPSRPAGSGRWRTASPAASATSWW